jgi:hypothetical protein
LGIAHLRAFLRRHRTIALDTNVFVYHMEANLRYLPLTEEVFSWLDHGHSMAVTSTLTMTELLLHPYRQSDQNRANLFYGLVAYPNLKMGRC